MSVQGRESFSIVVKYDGTRMARDVILHAPCPAVRVK